MATKTVSAALDAERYAELKAYAEAKGVKPDEAATMVLNTGLSRLAALSKHQKKKAKEAKSAGAAPRAPKAVKTKAAPVAKPAKAAKPVKAKAVKASAKAAPVAARAVGRKPKAAEPVAAPVEAKAVAKPKRSSLASVARKGGTVSRIAPQRPALPQANGTPVEEMEDDESEAEAAQA